MRRASISTFTKPQSAFLPSDMAFRISEAVLSGVSTWRDYELHKAREKLQADNHNLEMKLMKDHHAKEESLAKQIYLVEKFTEIEQHFQQLNADLLTVSKESERDMFDQRNQQFSTILVATTIVLSGLITVLIQGVLPSGTSSFLQIVYAISNSGSMALLFICSVLCLEIIWRASQFMYKRSKIHTYDLSNAIKKTKDMMRKVRGIKAYEMASLDRPKSRRHISDMTDEEIMIEFAQHETEVQKYLQQRQKIIDKAAYMVFSEDGNSKDGESFSHFWRDSCGYYSNAAILFFYGGSALLFIATMVYMWARFDYVLSSHVAATVSVYLISFALLTSLILVLYLRYYDQKYLDNKDKFESDNRKAEIRLNRVEQEISQSEPLEIPLPSSQNTFPSSNLPFNSNGNCNSNVPKNQTSFHSNDYNINNNNNSSNNSNNNSNDYNRNNEKNDLRLNHSRNHSHANPNHRRQTSSRNLCTIPEETEE